MAEEQGPAAPVAAVAATAITTPVDPVTALIGRIDQTASQAAHWKTLLGQIEAEVDGHVAGSLKSLSSGERKDLVDRLKDRRDHLSLSSGVTDKILGICQQILAFGAGGVALAVPFLEKARTLPVPLQKAVAVAATFYGQLVLLSLLILVLYMLQARFRYPFLYFQKIGNAWPYFYYASISRDTPRWAFPRFPRHSLRGGVRYAQDYVRFVERSVAETDVDRARNELQQYFLLLAYQGYVHQFSLRLTNWFLYGLVGAIVSTVLLGLWAFL